MNLNLTDILLVEDNDHDAELTIYELRKHNVGNNLLRLSDGEEALEFIFATGKFSGQRGVENLLKLILLDIKMPKTDGIEVLARIKSDIRTKLTPVVILTSSNQDPDIRRCYDLGANSYIVKPVRFEDFTRAIMNLGSYWLLLNQAP